MAAFLRDICGWLGPARPLPRLLTGNIWGIVFVIGCKHKNFLLGKQLYCHMQQAFIFYPAIFEFVFRYLVIRRKGLM